MRANCRKVYKDEQRYTNIDSIRAYRFRIYPDTKRHKEKDERIVLAQQLYNVILEKGESGTYSATIGCRGSPRSLIVWRMSHNTVTKYKFIEMRLHYTTMLNTLSIYLFCCLNY